MDPIRITRRAPSRKVTSEDEEPISLLLESDIRPTEEPVRLQRSFRGPELTQDERKKRIQEKVKKQATSLAEKKTLSENGKVRRYNEPTLKTAHQIARTRGEQNATSVLKAIKARGPQTLAEIMAEQREKGLVPVRIHGGIKFVKPEEADKQ